MQQGQVFTTRVSFYLKYLGFPLTKPGSWYLISLLGLFVPWPQSTMMQRRHIQMVVKHKFFLNLPCKSIHSTNDGLWWWLYPLISELLKSDEKKAFARVHFSHNTLHPANHPNIQTLFISGNESKRWWRLVLYCCYKTWVIWPLDLCSVVKNILEWYAICSILR
jgi:hypothetical protein